MTDIPHPPDSAASTPSSPALPSAQTPQAKVDAVRASWSELKRRYEPRVQAAGFDTIPEPDSPEFPHFLAALNAKEPHLARDLVSETRQLRREMNMPSSGSARRRERNRETRRVMFMKQTPDGRWVLDKSKAPVYGMVGLLALGGLLTAIYALPRLPGKSVIASTNGAVPAQEDQPIRPTTPSQSETATAETLQESREALNRFRRERQDQDAEPSTPTPSVSPAPGLLSDAANSSTYTPLASENNPPPPPAVVQSPPQQTPAVFAPVTNPPPVPVTSTLPVASPPPAPPTPAPFTPEPSPALVPAPVPTPVVVTSPPAITPDLAFGGAEIDPAPSRPAAPTPSRSTTPAPSRRAVPAPAAARAASVRPTTPAVPVAVRSSPVASTPNVSFGAGTAPAVSPRVVPSPAPVAPPAATPSTPVEEAFGGSFTPPPVETQAVTAAPAPVAGAAGQDAEVPFGAVDTGGAPSEERTLQFASGMVYERQPRQAAATAAPGAAGASGGLAAETPFGSAATNPASKIGATGPFKPLQQIPAVLMTAIRTPNGGSVPVIALTADGGSFVGVATINAALARVDMLFRRYVAADGKIYDIDALAYAREGSNLTQGLPADVKVVAPTLALDAAQNSANSLNTYVQNAAAAAKGTQGTSVAIGDNLSISGPSASSLASTLLGGLGSTFKMPENTQTIIRVATVPGNSPMTIIAGLGGEMR